MNDLKQKIFNAASELQLVEFATVTEDGKPWVRYVMGKADKDLIFRFCTSLESRKIDQIRNNPNVHILMGVTNFENAENWLQVEGTAEISTNRTELEPFWFDELYNYFSGPDDPRYCVVIVKASRIEFGTMGNMLPEVWERWEHS